MAGETTTSSVSNQIAAAYDTVAWFALRSVPVFDQFSSVKAGSLTNPGTPVTFHIWTDLALQTSALNEVTDVTPVALASTTTTVTPVEQGMTTVTTAKVRADSMLPAFEPGRANLVAYNMARSLDKLAQTALEGSSNEITVDGGAESALTAADVVTADFFRQQQAELVNDNVMPLGDGYAAIIHPHVAYDLKSETGDGAWVSPTQYVNTEKIYNNEIGKFAGFKFIESNLALVTTDGGASTVDTYRTYMLGQEALAKAVSIAPGIVPGPITDYLKRLVPLGWYGYLGWDTFRDEAARIGVSASSIGANT